jgi:hypothetical protein
MGYNHPKTNVAHAERVVEAIRAAGVSDDTAECSTADYAGCVLFFSYIIYF